VDAFVSRLMMDESHSTVTHSSACGPGCTLYGSDSAIAATLVSTCAGGVTEATAIAPRIVRLKCRWNPS